MMLTLETTFGKKSFIGLILLNNYILGVQNMIPLRETSTPLLALYTLVMEEMATGMVVTGVGVRQIFSTWTVEPCVQKVGRQVVRK